MHTSLTTPFDPFKEKTLYKALLRHKQLTLDAGPQFQALIQFNLCTSVNRTGWRIYPWPAYLNYFQIIKARERGFGGEEVERNRQKAALISLEQITSISAPETGGNLPDRELRVRELLWWRGKRKRERSGRTCQTSPIFWRSTTRTHIT